MVFYQSLPIFGQSAGCSSVKYRFNLGGDLWSYQLRELESPVTGSHELVRNFMHKLLLASMV